MREAPVLLTSLLTQRLPHSIPMHTGALAQGGPRTPALSPGSVAELSSSLLVNHQPESEGRARLCLRLLLGASVLLKKIVKHLKLGNRA